MVLSDCQLLLNSYSFCMLKQPTEYNTYADIDAAYKCLKEQYGVKDNQLILYGQSVGSGPTLDLASRLPELRGVVLHSPILSGVRVLYPVKRTYWFDIYKVDSLFLLIVFQYVSFNRWILTWFLFLLSRIWIKLVQSNALSWLYM